MTKCKAASHIANSVEEANRTNPECQDSFHVCFQKDTNEKLFKEYFANKEKIEGFSFWLDGVTHRKVVFPKLRHFSSQAGIFL